MQTLCNKMAATTCGMSGLQVSSKSSCLVRQWLNEDQNKHTRTSSSFVINFQERPERLGLGAELSAADFQRYPKHPLCQSYSGSSRPSPLNGGALASSLQYKKSANLKSQPAQLQDTSRPKNHVISSNELEVLGSKRRTNSSRLFVASDSDEDVSRECLGTSKTERVNYRSKLKAKHVNLRKENKSTVRKQQQQLIQNHHHHHQQQQQQKQVQQNQQQQQQQVQLNHHHHQHHRHHHHHQQQQVQQNHHHQQQVQQNHHHHQQVQQNHHQQQRQHKTLPQQCSNVSGRRCKHDLQEDLRTVSVAETCIPQAVPYTQEVDIDRSSRNQAYINPPSGNQVDISPFSSEVFHKRRKRTRQYLCIPVSGQMVLMCLYGPAAGAHGVRRRKTAFQLKQTILMHSRREFVPYFVTRKFR